MAILILTLRQNQTFCERKKIKYLFFYMASSPLLRHLYLHKCNGLNSNKTKSKKQ